MRTLILALPLLLAACTNPVVIGCPSVPEYPSAFQTKAADEMATLPADSVLRRMVDDYKKMRDEARACAK